MLFNYILIWNLINIKNLKLNIFQIILNNIIQRFMKKGSLMFIGIILL